MFNVGRKAKALDEFAVWEPGIFKEKINYESSKVSFCSCAPKPEIPTLPIWSRFDV